MDINPDKISQHHSDHSDHNAAGQHHIFNQNNNYILLVRKSNQDDTRYSRLIILQENIACLDFCDLVTLGAN